MGMSASQARLMTLTARLSDLELQAQTISNAKIRLSQQSEQVATAYSDALNVQKLQVLNGVNINTQAESYIDASAYNLTTYNAVSTTDKQRFLRDANGKILVTSQIAGAFQDCKGDEEAFLNLLGYTSDKSVKTLTQKDVTVTTEKDGPNPGTKIVSVTDLGMKNVIYDSGAVTYYQNVFQQLQANGFDAPGDSNMMSSQWLYSQLSSGNVSLSEWNNNGGTDGTGTWNTVAWNSGDPTLKVTSDDNQAAKAEANYDAANAEIESKDKKFDLELQSIDTEHTAVQTEIDSVKKVIEKNIERSFKIFNA